MNSKSKRFSNYCLRSALAVLKREFRKWYGMISVKELAANRELAFEIGVLEQMLARQGV
ncbi:MAG: hypothetical protein AB7K68_15090 [Bacteriovoracia bacterium]